jgi:hypothetical protein
MYVYLHFSAGSAVSPISDDFRQIEFTKSMDSLLDCLQLESFGMFRPVKSLLFYAAYKWDLGHSFYQYFGAVMAVLCCLLTWRVSCRIFRVGAWACLSALLWLYLPLNVVIFNWASALNISVYYCFSLLAVFFAAKMSECIDSRGQYLYLSFVILAYVGALFSYEMALSVPVLIGLYLVFFGGKGAGRSTYTALCLGLILVTLLFFLTRSVLLTGSTASISGNSLIVESEPWLLSFVSSFSYFEHLRFLFWPFNGFEFLIPLDPGANFAAAAIAWIAILFMVLLGLKMYSRFPYLLFALLWSAISLVTVLNFIPIGAGPLAEYYMPLAAFGWIVFLVAVLRVCAQRFSLESGCFALVFAGLMPVLLFGREVAQRQHGWRSEEALYSQIAARSDRSHKVVALLAQIRLGQWRFVEALELAERAMAMSTENADYVALYLACLKPSISTQKMEALLVAALEIHPDESTLLILEGDLLLAKNYQNESEQAYVRAYEQAVTKWDQAAALNAMGFLHVARGDFEAAADTFAQALSIKPYDATIRANWLQACEDSGTLKTE